MPTDCAPLVTLQTFTCSFAIHIKYGSAQLIILKKTCSKGLPSQ